MINCRRINGYRETRSEIYHCKNKRIQLEIDETDELLPEQSACEIETRRCVASRLQTVQLFFESWNRRNACVYACTLYVHT